ncbi:MAG TPA: DNA polymerase III subunit delta' [Alphaproteobacteria bacterium]
MSLFDDIDDDVEDDDDTETSAPVVDIAGLPEARLQTDLIGHASAEKQILEWWSSGHMPHALVIAGPKGIGKATLAFRLARFLLAHPDLPGESLFGAPEIPESLSIPQFDKIYSLVASGGHPDMMVVERAFDDRKNDFRQEIVVDDVRGVPSFLRMTASMGGWRVVLIDDADTLNRNAQNALLKVLEEPPPQTLLMLVAHSAGALIPTIRSRSRVLNLSPLSKDDFATLLKRGAPNLMQGDIDLLMDYAAGSPGQALDLLEQGGVAGIRGVLSLFDTLPSANEATIHKTADQLAVRGTPDPLMGMLDVSAWALRDKARAAAASNETTGMKRWLSALDQLDAHRTMCDKGNLDRKHLAFGSLRILQKALKSA